MSDLKAHYRQALAGRIAALELARSQSGAESEASVRRLAHALRGSGGTYGFPEVSAAAAAVEDAESDDVPALTDRLIATMRAVITPETEERILAVEDQPDDALLLVTALQSDTLVVTVVDTGAAALEAIAAGHVSLVLLDILLPDMDGRALLLKLRENPMSASTPIIVLSAKSDPAVKAECFDLGASGFLEKPIEPGLLAAVVNAQLRTARTDRTAQDEEKGAAPKAREKGASAVLVVDDDDLVVNVLRHRLEREGYRVIHCGDGVSAMAALEHEPVELAILDVKLPGVDGFDVLARLRAHEPTSRTPVIMLTSLGGEKDVLRAFQLGADDYITKPFSPAEVLARVARLLPSLRR